MDIFEDGTVVLVKLTGHTKGSVGMFVNLKSGTQYFFTGDLTWAAEAFIGPSAKHSIPGSMVDGNSEQLKETIVQVHHLMNSKPELKVIPAHDFNGQKDIAHYPDVEW